MGAPEHRAAIPPDERHAIAEAWLKRTVEAYPARTAEMLLSRDDRFRNPVGYAFRTGIPVLLDAALGAVEIDAAAPVLDDLLRIRAVQDFSASEAVSFISWLKPVLRGRGRLDEQVEDRIDRLALMAFDAYARCREALLSIRAAERRRMNFLPERMRHA